MGNWVPFLSDGGFGFGRSEKGIESKRESLQSIRKKANQIKYLRDINSMVGSEGKGSVGKVRG
uniref:Uncharacterized protein n=1 Tax=Picea glauca TaxID=3330 RepID=A0A117NH68_PICGL|nr:hypothetical protein ABT39_MTgene4817 [Picea glauca]